MSGLFVSSSVFRSNSRADAQGVKPTRRHSRSNSSSFNIFDNYNVTQQVLGEGHFSTVKLGLRKGTEDKVAVKVVNKSKAKNEEKLKAEVNILQKCARLKHPNIIQLLDVFDTPSTLYLVMELVEGGELFDRIVAKGFYSEKEAQGAVRQMASAVSYLHSNGIVHRDLKPENLLYASKQDDSLLKIADFGLAKSFDNNIQSMSSPCGTPGYVAPEVLIKKGYDMAVDLWALGVICYILLCGFPPFYEDRSGQLFEKIKKGIYDFPHKYWKDISKEAKSLVQGLLVVNPRDRMTAEDVLAHPWMVEGQAQERPLLSPQGLKEGKTNSKEWQLAVDMSLTINRLENSTLEEAVIDPPNGTLWQRRQEEAQESTPTRLPSSSVEYTRPTPTTTRPPSSSVELSPAKPPAPPSSSTEYEPITPPPRVQSLQGRLPAATKCSDGAAAPQTSNAPASQAASTTEDGTAPQSSGALAPEAATTDVDTAPQ